MSNTLQQMQEKEENLTEDQWPSMMTCLFVHIVFFIYKFGAGAAFPGYKSMLFDSSRTQEMDFRAIVNSRRRKDIINLKNEMNTKLDTKAAMW